MSILNNRDPNTPMDSETREYLKKSRTFFEGWDDESFFEPMTRKMKSQGVGSRLTNIDKSASQSLVKTMENGTFRSRIQNARRDFVEPLHESLGFYAEEERKGRLLHHRENVSLLRTIDEKLAKQPDEISKPIVDRIQQAYFTFMRMPVWTTIKATYDFVLKPLAGFMRSALFGTGRKNQTQLMELKKQTALMKSGEFDGTRSFFEKIREDGILGAGGKAVMSGLGTVLSGGAISKRAAQEAADAKTLGETRSMTQRLSGMFYKDLKVRDRQRVEDNRKPTDFVPEEPEQILPNMIEITRPLEGILLELQSLSNMIEFTSNMSEVTGPLEGILLELQSQNKMFSRILPRGSRRGVLIDHRTVSDLTEDQSRIRKIAQTEHDLNMLEYTKEQSRKELNDEAMDVTSEYLPAVVEEIKGIDGMGSKQEGSVVGSMLPFLMALPMIAAMLATVNWLSVGKTIWYGIRAFGKTITNWWEESENVQAFRGMVRGFVDNFIEFVRDTGPTVASMMWEGLKAAAPSISAGIVSGLNWTGDFIREAIKDVDWGSVTEALTEIAFTFAWNLAHIVNDVAENSMRGIMRKIVGDENLSRYDRANDAFLEFQERYLGADISNQRSYGQSYGEEELAGRRAYIDRVSGLMDSFDESIDLRGVNNMLYSRTGSREQDAVVADAISTQLQRAYDNHGEEARDTLLGMIANRYDVDPSSVERFIRTNTQSQKRENEQVARNILEHSVEQVSEGIQDAAKDGKIVEDVTDDLPPGVLPSITGEFRGAALKGSYDERLLAFEEYAKNFSKNQLNRMADLGVDVDDPMSILSHQNPQAAGAMSFLRDNPDAIQDFLNDPDGFISTHVEKASSGIQRFRGRGTGKSMAEQIENTFGEDGDAQGNEALEVVAVNSLSQTDYLRNINTLMESLVTLNKAENKNNVAGRTTEVRRHLSGGGSPFGMDLGEFSALNAVS